MAEIDVGQSMFDCKEVCNNLYHVVSRHVSEHPRQNKEVAASLAWAAMTVHHHNRCSTPTPQCPTFPSNSQEDALAHEDDTAAATTPPTEQCMTNTFSFPFPEHTSKCVHTGLSCLCPLPFFSFNGDGDQSGFAAHTDHGFGSDLDDLMRNLETVQPGEDFPEFDNDDSIPGEIFPDLDIDSWSWDA
jgi:hypothetical protein